MREKTRAEGRVTPALTTLLRIPFPPFANGGHVDRDLQGMSTFFFCKGRRRCRGDPEKEEEEEEEDLFVFNDTIEGPRAPAVKPGRVTQA